MNITVNVDGVTIDSVISERYNDERDRREPLTLGEACVAEAVDRLAQTAEWGTLRERIAKARDEEIRKRVNAELDDAMGGSIRQTNAYGEPTGPETTLRALIVAEAKKFFTTKERDGYRETGMTGAQRVVAEAVGKALTKELAEAVAEEKVKVVVAVRAKAAELIAQAVKEGVGR